MATEQIDGSDAGGQILPGTIGDAAIAAAANIASTKLAAWSANSNAGGFSLTNLGAGAASNAAATVQQAQGSVSWLGTLGGTANARTGTTTPSVTPFAGMMVQGLISAANTGAATLNINGSGAVAIRNMNVALSANMMGANCIHTFVRTAGGLWELTNPMPIFGQGYVFTETVSVISTTSTTFADYYNVTTASVPAGTYLVLCVVVMGGTDGEFILEGSISGNLLQTNGGPRFDLLQTQDRYNIVMIDFWTLAAGTQTLRLRYRSANGFNTTIRESRMFAWRVS